MTHEGQLELEAGSSESSPPSQSEPSAQPCQTLTLDIRDLHQAQVPESPNPVTPTKPPRNDRAGFDNSRERAVPPEEDIERELFEEALQLMHLSGLKKLSGHKGLDTDLHLWKKASAWHKTRTGIRTSFITVLCGICASA
jgi:hypothetical protein